MVHQERVFICHACAEARLSFTAVLALGYWAPLGLFTAVGVLTLAFWLGLSGGLREETHRNACGGLLLLAAGLFLFSLQVFRGGRRLLRYVLLKHYQQRVLPDATVTRLAIDLRKGEILQSLGVPEADVRFLTEADRLPEK
jgi:hypothetical protein